MSDAAAFYDGFAADYHLAYAGEWEAAVDVWGAALDGLIREVVPGAREVFDCACGIGTQAIGLARKGFRVLATDASPGAVARAQREAARFGVDLAPAVADFRDLSGITGTFDVVVACDNALPHMLDDAGLHRALSEMHSHLRPGGALIATLRDFDRALVDRPPVAPPTVVAGPPRRMLLRLHDWDADGAPFYTVRFIVLTESGDGWSVVEHRTRYRALRRAELDAAARSAGFSEVRWRDAGTVTGIGQQVMIALAQPSAA